MARSSALADAVASSVAMDDAQLESLRAALAASPDNAELLVVLLEAHLARGEAREACELLARCGEALRDPRARLAAARACREAARPEEGRELLGEPAANTPPGELVEHARLLLALDRREEAASLYRRAVEENPALEDRDLALQLRTRVHDVAADDERGRFRVISGEGDRDEPDPELARLLEPEAETVSFDDVGGLDDVKKQVRKRIILPFQKPSLFRRFKKRVGGGILLYGPPGCGKTLLARATAGECEAQFFSVAISDILDMWVGESEQKLHALFEKARAAAPAVLFFDEVEALGGKRQYQRESATSKLVSQFLAEMDGFSQGNQGVLVLGATNVPWAVDAAFRRTGRFDRTMFVPPPDRPARMRILGIHLRGRPTDGTVDVEALAKRTGGHSGADLLGLVEAAADAAIEESLEHEREVAIGQRHFKTALEEVRPTTLEWLTTARNHARYANEGGQYDEVLRFLDRFGRA